MLLLLSFSVKMIASPRARLHSQPSTTAQRRGGGAAELRKLEEFSEKLREAGTPPFEAVVEMLRAVGYVGKT